MSTRKPTPKKLVPDTKVEKVNFSKVGRKSKRKGNSFEIKVSKKFSMWISNGECEDLIWRSIGSGGFSSVRVDKNKKGFESQSGDLSSIDPRSKEFFENVSIECKNRESLQVENLVFCKKSYLMEAWEKHKSDSIKLGKIPVLVFKKSLSDDILMMENKLLWELVEEAFYNRSTSENVSTEDVTKLFKNSGVNEFHNFGLCTIKLDSFLNLISYSDFSNSLWRK